MKRLVLALAAMFIFCISSFSQKVAEGVPVTKEGHEIFAVLTKWADARKNGDVKALNEIYSDQLIITAYDDSMRGKKEETAYVRPGDPYNSLHSFHDVKVRLFGNAAAVIGVEMVQLKLTHPTTGKPASPVSFRFTAVFAKEDGRWQLMVLHLGKGKSN